MYSNLLWLHLIDCCFSCDLINYKQNVVEQSYYQVIKLTKPSNSCLSLNHKINNYPIKPGRDLFKPVLVKDHFNTETNAIPSLAAFSLNQLKFVGTLQRTTQIWALIERPDKQLVHVSIGEYIGKNNGQVVNITPKHVQIKDSVRQLEVEKKQIVILSLPK